MKKLVVLLFIFLVIAVSVSCIAESSSLQDRLYASVKVHTDVTPDPNRTETYYSWKLKRELNVRSEVKDYFDDAIAKIFELNEINTIYDAIINGATIESTLAYEEIAKNLIEIYEKYDLTEDEKYLYYSDVGLFFENFGLLHSDAGR